MTLEQLRVFVAVAEKEHVTQAAKTLNLTQSAASAAIASLEASYNIKLFDRIRRGIVLNHTGRSFLIEARAVLARVSAAERMLGDLAGLASGCLVIAASQTVANYWLPPRLQAFQVKYPGIKLHLSIENTERVTEAVREGRADFGFVEGQVTDPSLSSLKIQGDHLIVVVGMNHPWARQRKITPKALITTDWILREPGSGTRSMFEVALRRFGIRLADLSIKLELPSNESIRSAVEAGTCATAISELVAAPSLAAKTLHHVNIELHRRPFFILRHRQKHISHANEAFIQALDSYVSSSVTQMKPVTKG
jgi:DNA-binding transcriptional LysR family regulator